MANNVDVKDFTLGTARTMKTRETAGVNTAIHQIEDSSGVEVEFATETTSAAILAKLIAAPATSAKQDTIATALGLLGTQVTSAAILAKLADPATQTTLAAVLAKLIAAPATEAKQDTGNTSLASILAKMTADPATQTTLASILAKLIAAPATEAKQDTANTSLASLDTKTPALGQALAAGAVPVVLTAIQQTALTPPAAITGFSTAAEQALQLTQETAINTVLGTTAGAAVTTNATGTIQQYLRGVVSLLVSGITVATHAVTQSGAWVMTGFKDSAGTDMTDTTNHALKVNVVAGAGSGGTASTVGSAAPTTATAVGFSDGTNMVLARVKAASTAPVATDPAIVVAISPNSVNANGQTTASASAPVVIASDQSAVAVKAASGAIASGAIADLAHGQAAMAASVPVVLASNQSSIPVAATLAAETTKVIGTVNVSSGQKITNVDGYGEYETVAASQTAQALGATGATGDYLAGVLVFPGTAGCGVVTILDNATTIGTFAGGGTTALPSLVPFLIPVGLFSKSGAWKITTGANVTAVGIGDFT